MKRRYKVKPVKKKRMKAPKKNSTKKIRAEKSSEGLMRYLRNC